MLRPLHRSIPVLGGAADAVAAPDIPTGSFAFHIHEFRPAVVMFFGLQRLNRAPVNFR